MAILPLAWSSDYTVEVLRRPVKKLLDQLGHNDYQTLNIIELDAQRMIHNVAAIQRQHTAFGIIPVLKANAYGHGLVEVATILNRCRCDFVAVDGYFEAAKIRDISKHKVLVMGYIDPVNVGLLDVKRCSFVIQDEVSLRAFGKLKQTVRVHLELNTGMNRLGLQSDEVRGYLRTLKSFPNLQLEGVMTHLADADNDHNDQYTERQTQLFDQQVKAILADGFTPKFIHIAQTAGSTKAKSQFANAIRLGIGLYGINPLSPRDQHFSELSTLQPVLELKSKIIKTMTLNKGDRVSYNGIYIAPAVMQIATLPAGYYEGVPRELSNKGTATYKEKELPFVGRVCMNHTMLDISDSDLSVGSQVTLISKDNKKSNSVQQLSQRYNLFPYTLLTNLSSSIRRRVI